MKNKIKMKIIFISAMFILIGFSQPVFASTDTGYCPSPQEGLPGGFFSYKGSIVPCGRQCDDPGTPDINETDACTLCHFMVMANRIFNLLLALLIIVGLVFLTVAGVLYIVSGANTAWRSTAKKIITSTLTGFGLFLLSWLIVFTGLKFLSVNSSEFIQGESWYKFTCDTESVFN